MDGWECFASSKVPQASLVILFSFTYYTVQIINRILCMYLEYLIVNKDILIEKHSLFSLGYLL